MKVEREKALEHKKRMSRMMEDKENFLSKITAARSFIYKVRSAPLICEEECSGEKLTVTFCEHECLTWRSINGILSFCVLSVYRWFKDCCSLSKGKTESFWGALGGGEKEALGRKEETAQRGATQRFLPPERGRGAAYPWGAAQER